MSLSVPVFRDRVALFQGFALAMMLHAAPAHSQSGNMGCRLESVGAASGTVLRCGNGLAIAAEKGARYSLVDRDRDGVADAVRLRRKALFVDAPKSTAGPGFQIITPQAIAAVRGTKWAVDAASGKTSVFVVEGSVSVQRSSGSSRAVLAPGEGVDVARGTAPLEIRRWPAARVAALLARLGR